jgi:hypothetical protein
MFKKTSCASSVRIESLSWSNSEVLSIYQLDQSHKAAIDNPDSFVAIRSPTLSSRQCESILCVHGLHSSVFDDNDTTLCFSTICFSLTIVMHLVILRHKETLLVGQSGLVVLDLLL